VDLQATSRRRSGVLAKCNIYTSVAQSLANLTCTLNRISGKFRGSSGLKPLREDLAGMVGHR
jgi:hypothetical protein